MILFCPFCRKEPSVGVWSLGGAYVVECCGVRAECSTSAGTVRRWNEIARAVTERRAGAVAKRIRKAMAPLSPEQFREAMNSYSAKKAIEAAR